MLFSTEKSKKHFLLFLQKHRKISDSFSIDKGFSVILAKLTVLLVRPDDPFVEKEKVRFIKILRSAGVSALSSKTSARDSGSRGWHNKTTVRPSLFFMRIVFKTRRQVIMHLKNNAGIVVFLGPRLPDCQTDQYF